MKHTADARMNELDVRNRQKFRRVNTVLLKQIAGTLLTEVFRNQSFQLGVFFVSQTRMTSLNETYLRHRGSTDVITFDYRSRDSQPAIHGEIFISVHDAIRQAHEHRTTWQSEIVRYLIHGLLHLNGYDDLHPEPRRLMKRKEQRLLDRVGSQFCLDAIGQA